MGLVKRATADSVRHAGHWSGLTLLFGTPVLTFLTDYFLIGRRDPALWDSLASALISLAAVVSLIFIYNLLAAPFRAERERANLLEGEKSALDEANRQLQEALEERPCISLRLVSVRIGKFEDGTAYLVSIHVTNTGRARTSFPFSFMAILDRGGNLRQLQHLKTTGDISIDSDEGWYETFSGTQSISFKLSAPLEPNQHIGGPLIGIDPTGYVAEAGDRLIVGIKDIFDQEYRVEHVFHGIDMPDGMYRPRKKPSEAPP